MWVSPHLLKFTINFVGSGDQLSWVFDLRPLAKLSYLEHWIIVCLIPTSPSPSKYTIGWNVATHRLLFVTFFAMDFYSESLIH